VDIHRGRICNGAAHRFGVARLWELVHFTSLPNDFDELGIKYGQRAWCLETGRCSLVQSSKPHHSKCCVTAETPLLPRYCANTLYPRIAELRFAVCFFPFANLGDLPLFGRYQYISNLSAVCYCRLFCSRGSPDCAEGSTPLELPSHAHEPKESHFDPTLPLDGERGA
jgi:hypothetical protein